MSKWRKAEKPYEKPSSIPFSPEKYTEAIDAAIKEMKISLKQTDNSSLKPLHCRLIRCITPNSKCNSGRDGAEMRAWEKVEKWLMEKDVETIEKFYKVKKSEEFDETWKRKHGVSALLNQLREQIDLAESYLSKNKSKNGEDTPFEREIPRGWREIADRVANQEDCSPNLKKVLIETMLWKHLPPHVQSIIIEENRKAANELD